MIIIGVDEAGYGPNLGPLAIGASAWWVPSGSTDLYKLLEQTVNRDGRDGRLAIADSKTLYKPGGSLARLELAVLAAGRIAGLTLRGLVRGEHAELPWYKDYDPRLPVDATAADIANAERLLVNATARPLALQVRLIEATELNDGIERLGTKGAVLSAASLELAREVLSDLLNSLTAPSEFATTPVLFQFDKHGGRNRYTAILQHTFACDWIETELESRSESAYRWRHAEREYRATFRVKGESQLPTALASMAAKYSRELCMRAFNNFWCSQTPGLRPTAGYPVDAQRFRTEIAAKQTQLGISDHTLWRCR